MGENSKKRRPTRCKSVGGRRGSAQLRKKTEAVRGDAAVPVGSKKKPAAFCKSTTQLMGIIIKQCLRTEQDTRSLRSHLRHSHHGYGARRREEHEGTDASVQRGSSGSCKGHTPGPVQLWAWGGLIAGLQKQGAAVGAANAATLSGYLKQLDGMKMDTKCDHVRFCRVDWTYQSEQARITLSVERSGVRGPVVSALQQLGSSTHVRQSTADPAVSRTPTMAGSPTRQVGSDGATLRAVGAWLGERVCDGRPCFRLVLM